MADLPSRLDLYAIGRDYVLQRADKIDAAQVDIQGSDVNVFVGSASVVAFYLVEQLAYSVNRLLLDGAENEDLDRYAWDRYQLTRKGAASAVGFVTFTRATTTGGSGNIPINTVLVTLNNVQYVTTQVAAFGGSDLVVSNVGVRAVQAGKDSQAGANYIVRFQSPPFDPTITVNNDLACAGGEDAEDDDTFKERIRSYWTTARRGTLGAIEFGALSVPGIVSASAVEAVSTSGDPARIVNLFIADSSGVSSAAQVASVETALFEYRAAGIRVVINTSVPSIVDVKYKLTFRSGVDSVSLTSTILAATVEFINSLGVNVTLTRAALYSLLQRYASDGLVLGSDSTTSIGDSILEPAGDIVPTPGTTLRALAENVTAV